jgi:hypothetical protein
MPTSTRWRESSKHRLHDEIVAVTEVLKLIGKMLLVLGDVLKAMAFAVRASSAKGEPEVSFQPSYLRHFLYSRSRLEESGLLSAPEDKVQGAISEAGVHGSVVIVAGFIDGTPRLLLGRGGGVIGLKESFPEDAVTEARNLVQIGQSCLPLFSRDVSRSWPGQGNVRFALLTLGGTYAAEADIESLENGSSPLSPLWETADRLCMELSKLLPERSNAADV